MDGSEVSSHCQHPEESNRSLPDYMLVRDRPLGISILAGLHLIGGVAMFAVLLLFNNQRGEIAGQMGEIGIPYWLLFASAVFLGVLAVVSGIGLIKGTRWGWWVTCLYYAYGIARAGNALFSSINYLIMWLNPIAAPVTITSNTEGES